TVVGDLALDATLHRRRVGDLRFVLARVLEGSADGRALGELKPVKGCEDVPADATVDLHVRAARLKVAPDLTAERRILRANDGIASNAAVAQDSHLVPGGKEIVRHLSVEHDRTAGRAHAASDLPSDDDALAGRDHVA